MITGHTSNLLLSQLPIAEFTCLSPLIQPVPILRKSTIYNVGNPVTYLYFPSGGLMTEVAWLADGRGLEVLCMGREGAVGVTALFGMETSSHEVSVQITGAASRISVSDLNHTLPSCPVLQDRLARYFHSLLFYVGQTALCTARHTLAQRCANKLLDAAERSGSWALPLTHENLALSLGVRRAGITGAMAEFESEGSVRCMRGWIEIIDAELLRLRSCECSANHQTTYAMPESRTPRLVNLR